MAGVGAAAISGSFYRERGVDTILDLSSASSHQHSCRNLITTLEYARLRCMLTTVLVLENAYALLKSLA